jgi:hypothetical protein
MSVKAASESAVSSRPASIAIVHFDRPGTGAIVIKGDNGRVIAAVIVYDDVPDYLGPASTKSAADFVGTLRERLMARLGDETVIAYIPAPSGDQLLAERPAYGETEASNAGMVLAETVISKLKALKASDFFPNCVVGGKLLDIYSLPRRELPSVADASALLNAAGMMGMDTGPQDEMKRKFTRWALIEANRTMSIVMAHKEGLLEAAIGDYDPVYIQSLKIGPLKIVGIPCSVLRNCSRHILKEPGNSVWLAQNINGTLLGSVLTCSSADQLEGRLLSAVFERDAACRLIASVLKEANGD